jgi:adenosylmethionine-8-amino-7-oxononanoate aminotransferase
MGAVFLRDLRHEYPVAVRATGMHIYDSSGKAYLDMSGGATVSCLGHQHPDVIEALQDQIGTMAFAHSAFFTNLPQERLAEALSARFGETGAKAYFTAGGSEANETALKMAWQYWRTLGQPGKTKVISREHSYHGNTLATLSASGNPARRAPMGQVLTDWPRIEPCYAYRYRRDDESEADYALRAANALETTILSAGADTVAAFIVETIGGASLGAVPPSPGYFHRIRQICDQYDVLLIADEIMCGTGRTGTFFAYEQEDFLPDIVTLAKGLGGGYQPLAATIARHKIAQLFAVQGNAFDHGHTYVGHASTCAAGTGVLEAIEKYQLLGTVTNKGDVLQDALVRHFGAHPNVGDIRGRGLLRAMEFVADKASKSPHATGSSIAHRLRDTAMEHGLICYPSGGSPGHGCHILFAPPFILQDIHIEDMVTKLKLVLEEVFDA